MNILRVEPPVLTYASEDLRSASSRIADTVDTLDRDMSILAGAWTGEGAEAAMQRWRLENADLMRISTDAERAARAVDQCRELYERADVAVAGIWSL